MIDEEKQKYSANQKDWIQLGIAILMLLSIPFLIMLFVPSADRQVQQNTVNKPEKQQVQPEEKIVTYSEAEILQQRTAKVYTKGYNTFLKVFVVKMDKKSALTIYYVHDGKFFEAYNLLGGLTYLDHQYEYIKYANTIDGRVYPFEVRSSRNNCLYIDTFGVEISYAQMEKMSNDYLTQKFKENDN